MPRVLTRAQAFKPVLVAPLIAAIVAISVPAPAIAQKQSAEARLRKVEAEVRAIQRKVFPGGDERYFAPQISSGTTTSRTTRTTGPSTTAVTDILARLDALELQLQQLTARTEENANAIALLSARLGEVEAGAAADQAAQVAAEAAEEAGNATDANLAAMGAGPSGEEQPAPEPAGPSDARLAAVKEITKPQSDDPADDEYSYGFRLWNAGFYPEARQQLSNFLDSYPDHWRATYGRNLLGRAYLDDGKAEEAARWFLKNYQADRTAARAPDSLLFLAESMIEMKDTRRACIALAEFGETYPAVAAGRLMERYQANRGKVTC